MLGFATADIKKLVADGARDTPAPSESFFFSISGRQVIGMVKKIGK